MHFIYSSRNGHLTDGMATYNLRLSVGNAMHTTKLSGDTSVHTR